MTWPIPDGAGAVGPTGPQGPEGPTGPAGSANITGTANKVVKFTSSTAGGDSSITDDGTTVVITEPTTIQRDALAATNVVGLKVTNTTASSGGVPVQKPAAIRHEGRARNTTGGGSDEAAAFEMRLLPVSGGTVHAEWSINYDVASGSGALGRWATNLPSMGGGGLYLTSTIVLSAASNGLRSEASGNPGWKFVSTDSIWDAGSGNAWIKSGSGAIRVEVTTTGNVALFSAGSYGGGTFVAFLANCTTAPTTNPSGGGILYAEGGALKWRGSSGTVSTIAPA